jgi:hypothetical protein
MNDKSKKGYDLRRMDDNFWLSSMVSRPWPVIDVEEFEESRSDITIDDNKFGVLLRGRGVTMMKWIAYCQQVCYNVLGIQ